MSLYALSLGSNIHPRKNIRACLRLLKKNFFILKQSSVYQTTPFGMSESPAFWNMALILESPFSSFKLCQKLRLLEKQLGRKASHHGFVSRPIDIDLLPYKDYRKHPFVLIPLAEIAPKLQDRATGKSLKFIAGKFKKEIKSYRKIKLKIT